MTSPAATSAEAYLAAERRAPARSDYLAGQVLPMPTPSSAHALLGTAIVAALARQSQGRGWVVRDGTQRLYAPAGPLFTYPDAALVCGEVRLRADGHHDNLLNPSLLVKVLPHAMPAHFKQVFELYYSIPTVQHVLLVTGYAALVSLGSRTAGGLLNVYGFKGLEDVILLPDLGLELPLAELYREVPLSA